MLTRWRDAIGRLKRDYPEINVTISIRFDAVYVYAQTVKQGRSFAVSKVVPWTEMDWIAGIDPVLKMLAASVASLVLLPPHQGRALRVVEGGREET